MKQLALGVQVRTEARFANFVPGRNSELLSTLHAASPAPLWLWGAHGSGKTHLLQAVCAAAGATAAYFPLRLPMRPPPEALLGFERCAVVCLDHLEAVAGEAAWEQALFRLFNEAADLGTRLIFAAVAPPRQLPWTLDDWRSRAGACVVYQVHELDDAGRVAALRLRAAQRGVELPPETCDYLLRRMPRDLPTLFDILDRLDEASLIERRRLTVPFIREALEKLAGTKS
jgi:DnaA family protein